MGLMFFPRGGSSHVAQNLAAALPGAGWQPTILSGSLSLPGRPGDARAFYHGLDVHTVDFTPALEAPDPQRADPPFQPSYEDRAGAPDVVFARLDDDAFERQVRAWAPALAEAGAARRRRPAPAPPDAALRGGRAGRARRAARRPPARHRAADARGDRGRRRLVAARRRLGAADAGLGGALRAPDRALRQPGPPRRAPARHRRRPLRPGLQRLRPRALPPARGRPRRALAAPPRRRAAGLAPGRGGGQRRLRRRRPRGVRDRAGAALRRALHRGQARRAADRGLRARPHGVRASRAAGARRRLPGRVGGRAPRGDDRRAPAPRTSTSPAGTATTSCPPSSTPPTSSCCPRSASSSARCWWRGWRAACRRSRSTPTARARSSATARPAGWSSRTIATGSPRRWSRPSTAPRSAAAAAIAPARSRSSATPGPRWRARWRRSTRPPGGRA